MHSTARRSLFTSKPPACLIFINPTWGGWGMLNEEARTVVLSMRPATRGHPSARPNPEINIAQNPRSHFCITRTAKGHTIRTAETKAQPYIPLGNYFVYFCSYKTQEDIKHIAFMTFIRVLSSKGSVGSPPPPNKRNKTGVAGGGPGRTGAPLSDCAEGLGFRV